MAIQSRKNQYLGVNAHQLSMLQTPGTFEQPSSWRGFHNHYIARIMEVLNEKLPAGYVAVSEESLQVLGEDDEGAPVRKKPTPDVTVYARKGIGVIPAGEAIASPTWEAVEVAREETRFTGAVIIYQQATESKSLWGKVVTRIEVLSRSNKRRGSNWMDYRHKRHETFLSGIPLVEIDLLHESRSPLVDLPIYPTDVQSYPYTVSISDPRTDTQQVQVQAYGFGVDQSFPTIPLPLSDKAFVGFNFGEAYHQAYERGPWHQVVDYESEPVRMDTYTPVDQARIRARLESVRAAHAAGVDLEQGPFPITETT